MGISNRGTQAKTITSCDNAFVTNIVLARDPGASNASEAAHRTLPGSFALCESVVLTKRQQCFICAKVQRQQQQMFYLRESEASEAKRPAGTEINPTLW
ncbi:MULTISPECIES: hypothetical protein [Lysinibacillus]|uniref:hypothetical protein n=1 Tax=Lysinibacillus TaxID=400634 RepID=UPI00083C97D3|nr:MULTISPECIES: hypothetical protein [Lysinibacillus]